MTDQDTDAFTIDQLTELRIHAKLLWESGILEPHEKQHLWTVLMRIDGKVKRSGNKRSHKVADFKRKSLYLVRVMEGLLLSG